MLTPQLEEVVRKRIESGHYASAGEVIREALWLLEAIGGRSSISPRADAPTLRWDGMASSIAVSDFDVGDIKRRGRIRLFSRDTGWG